MRPIVLLTCGGSAAPTDGGSARGGASGTPVPADFGPSGRAGVKIAYIRSVEAAGGAPLLLPNCPDAEAVAAAVEVADALLLTGGGDIHPQLYGQSAHPSVKRVDTVRDATEALAVRQAVRRGVPILGICRGIQVLNVALGGTLIQDIPSHLVAAPASQAGAEAAALNHSGTDHTVRVEGGSTLADIWPACELLVNSRHHQAVDRLAGQLKASAWAPDGIVEGVESSDGSPLLAVQCHPEDLSAERQEFLAPFGWLVERAMGR